MTFDDAFDIIFRETKIYIDNTKHELLLHVSFLLIKYILYEHLRILFYEKQSLNEKNNKIKLKSISRYFYFFTHITITHFNNFPP